MTRSAASAGALVAVVVIAAPAVAIAETPTDAPAAIDVERWAATATGWWAGLDDARVVGFGHLAVGLTTSAIARPIGLTAPNGDDLGAPVAHRATVTVAAAYGVTDSVEVDLAAPLVIQGGDRLTAVGEPRALRRVTSGDVRVGAKIQLITGPRVTAALGATLTLPTGNEGHYAGEASWVADWHGLVMVRSGPIALGIGVGVRLRGEEVALSPEQVAGNELTGAVALSWQVPTIPGVYCDWTQLRAIAELDGVLGDTVGGQRGPSPIEARLGVRGRIWRGWTVGVTAGRGLVGEVGSPRWRGVVEVSWRDEPRTDVPAPRARAPVDDDDDCGDDDDC